MNVKWIWWISFLPNNMELIFYLISDIYFDRVIGVCTAITGWGEAEVRSNFVENMRVSVTCLSPRDTAPKWEQVWAVLRVDTVSVRSSGGPTLGAGHRAGPGSQLIQSRHSIIRPGVSSRHCASNCVVTRNYTMPEHVWPLGSEEDKRRMSREVGSRLWRSRSQKRLRARVWRWALEETQGSALRALLPSQIWPTISIFRKLYGK